MTKNPAQPDEETAGQGAKDAQDEIKRENDSFNVPREDTALETESSTDRDR